MIKTGASLRLYLDQNRSESFKVTPELLFDGLARQFLTAKKK